MALYMVVEHYTHGPEPIYARVAERGRMLPDGLRYVDSWVVTPGLDGCFQLMEPDEAAPLRRLLSYDEKTAGGMMTTEPVILAPEATIAEALAMVRKEELAPALATMVYVCRPPLEVPTGRYLGLVHIQRLLREPPHASVGSIIDKEMDPLPAHA